MREFKLPVLLKRQYSLRVFRRRWLRHFVLKDIFVKDFFLKIKSRKSLKRFRFMSKNKRKLRRFKKLKKKVHRLSLFLKRNQFRLFFFKQISLLEIPSVSRKRIFLGSKEVFENITKIFINQISCKKKNNKSKIA